MFSSHVFCVYCFYMYYIEHKIYQEIVETIGKSSLEAGGIIGRKDNIICSFHFDKNGLCSESEYKPNVSEMNKIIKEWYSWGVEFAGIVHSHPNSYNRPSFNDGLYAKRLMDTNPSMERVLFPIVTRTYEIVTITFYEYTDDFYLVEVKMK